MAWFRPVLGVILAAIATLVVGCGGGTKASAPDTYTPEVLAQVQIFTPSVVALRERFPELEGYIQAKSWVDIGTFIHGPLGELRSRMNLLARTLLPGDDTKAQDLAKEVFRDLVRLDTAASDNNQVAAGKEYRNALDDFDAYLQLIPTVD